MKEQRYWHEWVPMENGQAQYEHLVKLFGVARRMKAFGTRVDPEACEAHVKSAAERRAHFTDKFLEITQLPSKALGEAGGGATAAVKAWFKAQGAPDVIFHKITKKPQFNQQALITWASESGDKPYGQAAAALLGLRKAVTAGKFASNYLIVSGANNGRIHFGFNPLGTKGERWSASAQFRIPGMEEPISLNAQNVPSKEPKFDFQDGNGPVKLALSLRNCFIPDPGCKWIKWDYEGAEARVMAVTTGCKTLLGWMDRGEDIHLQVARALFPSSNIPEEAATTPDKALREFYKKKFKNERDAAKGLLFGFAYAVTSPPRRGKPQDFFVETQFKQLKATFPDITEPAVKLMAKRFFGLLPEILEYHARIRREVGENNLVVLPQTGAQLYLADTMRGYNMGSNFFMQSGLGALINQAIPHIDTMCTYRPSELALLLTVHDEVDMQVPEADVPRIELAVSQLLERPMFIHGETLSVPASGAVGTHWGNGKDIR